MVSSAFRSWTLGVSIGLLTAAGMASAQPGIGYTSVAAALTDLKTRAGATVTVQGGWTIVDDPANSTIWSFAPPDHAAYPAVIKRTVFERDGQVMIEMRGLCQATKAPCDALTEEFMQMTEQTKKSLVPKAAPVSSGWAPSAEQASDAAALLARFHGAIDAGRYQEAHALLTPGMQAEIPLEQFVASEAGLRARVGGPLTRAIAKTTWYKDPPNAVGPGIFTAFDETCSARTMASCAEVVILHQPPHGDLRVLRYERTMQANAK